MQYAPIIIGVFLLVGAIFGLTASGKWFPNRQKQIKIALVPLLVIGFSLALIGTFSLVSAPKETAKAGIESFVAVGQPGRLLGDIGGVVLAATEEAIDKAMAASAENDTDSFGALIKSGQVFMVDDETKVLVVDEKSGLKKVKIIDGPYSGKTGWAPSELVQKPK